MLKNEKFECKKTKTENNNNVFMRNKTGPMERIKGNDENRTTYRMKNRWGVTDESESLVRIPVAFLTFTYVQIPLENV